jgi:methionine synthase II (cobalamin-independent)
MANNRISRDLDDRLQDRVEEIKERQAASLSPDEAVRRERLEAFRDKWANSALPDIPKGIIPGMHLCWLSTTNQYDSIDKRIALGYEPVKAAELGKGFEQLGKLSSGKFEGCVSCNEMVLFKLPEDIYQEVARMLHHEDPLEHQRNVTANVRSAAESGKGGRSILEGGMLEMEREASRASSLVRF